jgi:hypothetical protein
MPMLAAKQVSRKIVAGINFAKLAKRLLFGMNDESLIDDALDEVMASIMNETVVVLGNDHPVIDATKQG